MRGTIKGVVVPLITPYAQSGEINLEALKAHVEHLMAAGVHAFMLCGTTGEVAYLSLDERKRIAETVIEQVSKRLPVLVQVGAASTRDSLLLAEHAAHSGADAIGILAPYYYSLTDDDLIRHFCDVADAVPDMNTYLYNIPQNTGNKISVRVSSAVAARCQNVIGEKDSSGDLTTFAEKVGILEGQYDLLNGPDMLILPALTLGAVGAVCGNANVFPELFVSLFNAWWDNDLKQAQHHQRKVHEVIGIAKGDISMFKGLLAHRGLDVGQVRAPYRTAGHQEVLDVVSQLEAAGIQSAMYRSE